MPVVVVVADGDAMTIAPGEPTDPGGSSHVLERAVAPVPEEAVTRGSVALAGRRGERTSLDA